MAENINQQECLSESSEAKRGKGCPINLGNTEEDLMFYQQVVNNIAEIVSKYYSIPKYAIYNPKGHGYADAKKANNIAQWLCYEFLTRGGKQFKSMVNVNKNGMILEDIASMLGGVSHSAISQTMKRIRGRIDVEPAFAKQMEELVLLVYRNCDFGSMTYHTGAKMDDMSVEVLKNKNGHYYYRFISKKVTVTLSRAEFDTFTYIVKGLRAKGVTL